MGAILDRKCGERRPHLVALAVVLIGVAALIAGSRRPPILDLPLLFEQAVAFESAIGGASPELEIDWTAPNRLGYLPVLLARLLVAPEWAPRFAVFLVAALWLASIAALAVLARRCAATILLLAPVLFGSPFYAGFFNFLTGVAALLFWARELDDERRSRPWPRVALSTAAGALLLYFSHVTLLLVTGFAVATTVLLYRFDARETAARALGLVPVMVALSTWSGAGAGWQGEVRFGIPPLERVSSLGMASSLALGGVLHPVEKVVLVGILGWIALGTAKAVRDRGAGVHVFLLVAGVCFLTLALAAPNEIDKMVHVAWRWGGMALATLVLALPEPDVDRRFLMVAAAGLVAAHLLVTAAAWRRWSRVDLAGFETVIGSVPAGAELFAVDLARPTARLATDPSRHLYAWAAVERGATIRSSFTDTGHGLVRWADVTRRDSLAEFLLWQPAFVRPGDLTRFSHVLFHGPAATARAWAANSGARGLVVGHGNWGLFACR